MQRFSRLPTAPAAGFPGNRPGIGCPIGGKVGNNMNQNRTPSAGDLLGFHPRQCDTDSDEHGQEHDHHPPDDRRTWSNGVGQGGHLDVGRRLCEHVGGLGIVGAFPRRRQLRAGLRMRSVTDMSATCSLDGSPVLGRVGRNRRTGSRRRARE